MVPATSRPAAAQVLARKRAYHWDRRIEILGFKTKDIEHCITTYFKQKGALKQSEKRSEAQGEKLLAYLKSHPSAWGTAHVPIMLEMERCRN